MAHSSSRGDIHEDAASRACWSIDAMPRHFRTVAVILALAAFTVPSHVQTPDADLVIVNARVFTGVPATPWAEALSVIGDRIGVVGTTAAVRKVAGSSTRVIDAAGKTVVPGINDAHVHIGEEPSRYKAGRAAGDTAGSVARGHPGSTESGRRQGTEGWMDLR